VNIAGGVLGILGGGQLGRMIAMAARPMGLRTVVFTDEPSGPASQVADLTIVAKYDDKEALEKFAALVNVVTLEFENIPVAALEYLSGFVPVKPGVPTLYVAQNRQREKEFLSRNNYPLAPWAVVKSLEQLQAAVAKIGLPAVLKTAGFGYDGKGQKLIVEGEDLTAAWQSLGHTDAVLEKFITIDREFSIIGARGSGRFSHFGPIENKHKNHILDVSSIPARLSQELAAQAVAITESIMTELDSEGLLCVEFFLTDDMQVLVNEMAPRPHNSGHLTIEACPTSQFEQLIRAVWGLSLGTTTPFHSAAMVNLLGDIWQGSEPDFAAALDVAEAHLHLYGKAEARKGRKMGHITAVADSSSLAVELALRARARLKHEA
jgi:5-(carboxyamino)imidazole ribonucleotide synthase